MSIAGLAFDGQIREHFAVQRTRHFAGALSLVRPDPIDGDRGRAESPCDTVEPPGD